MVKYFWVIYNVEKSRGVNDLESIKIMVEEHENIRRMLKVVRSISYRVMKNSEYDLDDFRKIIDFVRIYADKHHHGKEEDVLFTTMTKEIEKIAKSGAITGMYIEHDMGRLYISSLEKALNDFEAGDDEARLDIIANGISYGNLLDRHIEKENTALYKFAENLLNNDSKNFVEEECKKVEDSATKTGLQQKYMGLLEELEKKYL